MSKKWHPNLTPGTSLPKGPPTRRMQVKGPRIKWIMSALKRLKGPTLAAWGTRASAMFAQTSVTVRYDADKALYIATDRSGDDHAFAHPRRLWTVFHGLERRGKTMLYSYLLDQIDVADGDIIVDIGANTGDLALGFRAIGRRVTLHAFEPAPGEFAALQFNLAANGALAAFKTHQLALWNETAEGLTFHLKSGSADSSLLPIKGATQTVTVPARRLDDVMGADIGPIKLIKLEAEGAEPEILEGATALLPQVAYIAADVGFERGEADQSTLPQVVNFLTRHGFEVVGYEGGRHVVLFRNSNLGGTGHSPAL